MKHAALAAIAALSLAVTACVRPEPVEIGPGQPGAGSAGAPTAADSTGQAPADAPWYAARLEALGFYVFPAPEPLPLFSVRTLDGKEAGVADLAGKVVLLNFWATWCPPCRAEMPSIEALWKATRDEAFTVMAISVNEPKATVTGFLKDNPYGYPMYLDETGEASAPFASRGIPTTFILDKQGRAIAGLVGSRSYDGPEVTGLIRELARKLP